MGEHVGVAEAVEAEGLVFCVLCNFSSGEDVPGNLVSGEYVPLSMGSST